MRLYKILVLLLLSCSTYAQWGPAQNSYQRIKGVWPFERLKLPSDTSATKEANTIVAVGNKLWLSNGTYYIDVTGAGGLGGVTSFNTRTGAVSLIANDVNVALGYIPVSPSDTASMLFAYARLTRFIDSCTALRSAINAIGTPPVSSVFGRTGAITAQAGDYSVYYPSISRFLDSTAAVWSRVQTNYQPAGSYLVAGNNLADVTNIATARTNLSIYSQSEVLQRITDSLGSILRLRASGSGGIQLQNSVGTNVADFGIANTTNGSIAGGWNVGGNSTISGTLGVTQKATFSDSIVGVNQRLSGTLNTTGSITTTSGNITAGGTEPYLIARGTTNNSFRGLKIFGQSDGNTEFAFSMANFTTGEYRHSAGFATYGGFHTWYTNGSEVMRLNTNGSLSISGALTANGKATFTDSIVGVNQRLSGTLNVSGNVGIGTTSPNTTLEIFGASEGEYFRAGGGTITDRSLRFSSYSVAGLTGVGHRINAPNANANIALAIGGTDRLTIASTGAATFSSSVTAQGALTATAQGNNITQSVDSAITGTSYTLVLGDAGYFKRVTNSSAVTITIPENSSVAFPVGTYIILQQQGTGQITIAPASSNVSFESPDGALKSRTRYSKLTLLKVNTNRWDIGGDLTN